MRYGDIILLIQNNPAPSDWIRVKNESGDGGATIYCREDVLLVITFQFITTQGKIIARFQFAYASTILGWTHIEMTEQAVPPTDEILRQVKSVLS